MTRLTFPGIPPLQKYEIHYLTPIRLLAGMTANVVHRLNTIIVVANLHDTTLISPEFFRDIKNIEEGSLLFRAGTSQVRLTSGTSIFLDPKKLLVTGPAEAQDEPFTIASRYCESWPSIECRAVRINSQYSLPAGGLNIPVILGCKLPTPLDSFLTKGIQFTFRSDDHYRGLLNIDITGISFDYHRDYNNVSFADVDKDFAEQWNLCLHTNDQILTALRLLNQQDAKPD